MDHRAPNLERFGLISVEGGKKLVFDGFINITLEGKVKLTILALATTLILAGCSSETTVTESFGGAPRNESLKERVTPETCRNGRTANSVFGTWYSRLHGENIQMDIGFTISPTSISIVNTCSIRGIRLQARVHSPVSHEENSFRIWNNDEDRKEYNNGGDRADCAVSVRASSVRYEFYGDCLVLIDEGNNKNYLQQAR